MFAFISEYRDRMRFVKTWLLNRYETLLGAQQNPEWKGRVWEKGLYQVTLQLLLILSVEKSVLCLLILKLNNFLDSALSVPSRLRAVAAGESCSLRELRGALPGDWGFLKILMRIYVAFNENKTPLALSLGWVIPDESFPLPTVAAHPGAGSDVLLATCYCDSWEQLGGGGVSAPHSCLKDNTSSLETTESFSFWKSTVTNSFDAHVLLF